MYRLIAPEVYFADQRLQLLAAAAVRDTTMAEVADVFGVSVPQVYKLRVQARRALQPRPPGPRPSPEPAASAASAAVQGLLGPRVDRRALVLQMAVSNVSIRGLQRLFVALKEPVPSRDWLVATLARAGRAARRLMARANDQVRDHLACAAGDDIFFHRVAIKVLLDPVSGALLDVMRWPWREAEDWALWIGAWPALRLFVSDLGTDLVGAVPLVNAARRVPLVHQADIFHECAWWTEHVFARLSRREAQRAQEARDCWDRATRVEGPGRRVTAATVAAADARRARAEADFYAAVALEERFQGLLQPLSPEGQLWTDARVVDLLADFARDVHVLPAWYAKQIGAHVHRHRTRWCAHRVLWDLIAVDLRAGEAWTRRDVLAAVVALRWAQRRERQATDWTSSRAAQVERETLQRWLDEACANVPDVVAAVATLIERPRRSSSLVEALNSRLRVLQMVHRNVSDHLLGLVALAWNLSRRQEGKRRGPSPYARLGIDFADDTRPWYEVLIQEMDAN